MKLPMQQSKSYCDNTTLAALTLKSFFTVASCVCSVEVNPKIGLWKNQQLCRPPSSPLSLSLSLGTIARSGRNKFINKRTDIFIRRTVTPVGWAGFSICIEWVDVYIYLLLILRRCINIIDYRRVLCRVMSRRTSVRFHHIVAVEKSGVAGDKTQIDRSRGAQLLNWKSVDAACYECDGHGVLEMFSRFDKLHQFLWWQWNL